LNLLSIVYRLVKIGDIWSSAHKISSYPLRRREGRLLLRLVPSLENILKAENMAASHLYSHTSTNHSTLLSLAPLPQTYCKL